MAYRIPYHTIRYNTACIAMQRNAIPYHATLYRHIRITLTIAIMVMLTMLRYTYCQYLTSISTEHRKGRHSTHHTPRTMHAIRCTYTTYTMYTTYTVYTTYVTEATYTIHTTYTSHTPHTHRLSTLHCTVRSLKGPFRSLGALTESVHSMRTMTFDITKHTMAQ